MHETGSLNSECGLRNAACPGAICQGLLMRLDQAADGIYRIRLSESGLGQGIWIEKPTVGRIQELRCTIQDAGCIIQDL